MANIGDSSEHLRADRPKLVESVIDILLFATGDRYPGAMFGEGLGDTEVDPGGATKHENMLVREIEGQRHHIPPRDFAFAN